MQANVTDRQGQRVSNSSGSTAAAKGNDDGTQCAAADQAPNWSGVWACGSAKALAAEHDSLPGVVSSNCCCVFIVCASTAAGTMVVSWSAPGLYYGLHSKPSAATATLRPAVLTARHSPPWEAHCNNSHCAQQPSQKTNSCITITLTSSKQ